MSHHPPSAPPPGGGGPEEQDPHQRPDHDQHGYGQGSAPDPHPQGGYGQHGSGQPPPYYTQGFAPPGYGGYTYPGPIHPPPTRTNVKAVVSLVLGLVGLPLLCLCSLGFLTGIPAIILGVMGLKENSRTGESGQGMAWSGIVIGVIASLLSIIGIIFFALGFFGAFTGTPWDGSEGFLFPSGA